MWCSLRTTVVALLGLMSAAGCYRSHARPEHRDAGTYTLEDGAVWTAPTPAESCPSDTPELFIPPLRGCVSIHIREGSEVPRPWTSLHRPPWRRPVHIVRHPDVQYHFPSDPDSDRATTARHYLQALGNPRCDTCWSCSGCRYDYRFSGVANGCVDDGGGLSDGVSFYRAPQYIGGYFGREYTSPELYLFVSIPDGVEWILYGCIGEDPPGYVGDP